MPAYEHDIEPPAAGRRPDPVRERDREPDAVPALAAGRLDAVTPQGLLHLQRTAGNREVGAALTDEQEPAAAVKDVVASGGGQPLDATTRSDMEARFGHDFSDVRIHTDSRASDSARAVQAHAYTVGSSIVFQRDRFAPQTDAGRRTLAHELTHVIQQRSGPVEGTPVPGGIRVSDPSDRFEQEAAAAEQVVSAPAVQRQDALEEEEEALPVQGSAVQRQDALEEEEEEA